MKKNLIFLVACAVLLGAVLFLGTDNKLGAVSPQGADYYPTNLTYGTVACASNAVAGNNTGTPLVAGADGRIHFSAVNRTLFGVGICRAGVSCGIATSTIIISATTSIDVPSTFDQEDNYKGAYTCVSDGATTTIGFNQAR